MKRRLFPVRDIMDAADECADAVRGELAQLAFSILKRIELGETFR